MMMMEQRTSVYTQLLHLLPPALSHFILLRTVFSVSVINNFFFLNYKIKMITLWFVCVLGYLVLYCCLPLSHSATRNHSYWHFIIVVLMLSSVPSHLQSAMHMNCAHTAEWPCGQIIIEMTTHFVFLNCAGLPGWHCLKISTGRYL